MLLFQALTCQNFVLGGGGRSAIQLVRGVDAVDAGGGGGGGDCAVEIDCGGGGRALHYI